MTSHVSLNRATGVLRFLLVMIAGSSLSAPSRAEVRLPQVFSEHTVLQRDKPLPVWGWAAPGERVTVSLDRQSASATADASGAWKVTLKEMPAGGPHKLTVAGRNTIELKDVLIGDVWVCSGQSNMAWELSRTQRAGQDIPKANYPNIRLLSVPLVLSGRPSADFKGDGWMRCTPETARGFSAVAFYFGKELHEELQVPVGLINASWGGSPIEPWTNPLGFAAIPSLKEYTNEIERANVQYRKTISAHIDRIENWIKEGPAWVAQARKAASADMDLPPIPPLEVPGHPLATGSSPTSMYNAMIHPLVPFAIRGAIWYQGESNNGQGMEYCEKMKALIGGWRNAWGQGDFPFLFVQIAPWRGYPDGNIEGIWEAQLASLAIPNTGMAVITDVGNIGDIHPANKHDVGHRLALWAKAKAYGKTDLVVSGPLFKSSAVEGNRIRVRCDHVGGGLVTRDGKEPNSFQIGTSEGFVNAQAKIEGDTVLVWSDSVTAPEAVRFGWSKVANPNLMNKEGLPASPFRTDCGTFTFSYPRRFLRSNLVEISGGHYSGTMRYTLDGTPPTAKSPAYTGPIKLTKTAKVAVRLFADDGRTSLVARADYTQAEPVVGEGKQLVAGIRYELYDGVWKQLPDFDSLKPIKTGNLDTLNLSPGGYRGNYGMRFNGYLDIAKDGEYTFFLASDDGSKLTIDGKDVLIHDNIHPAIEKRSDKIMLKAGKHPLVIAYFQGGGAAQLVLAYEGPGIPKQPVPETALLRTE